ncbi:transcription regulator HTH, apses-type DNA-binding domain-containing protein [Multifurca ochricompacta]|uniref:Transcription regulator HTH, apses-type DNA-binding domain-containing protein n=1 Tax=Multifurca ochricompacta TaxID=376703 RepID=A0AAD4QHU3_9AGAM|nr:transcription regulator HTH, apses-type DNA-binding domain-containing protein [Multifurca ochricompacta]
MTSGILQVSSDSLPSSGALPSSSPRFRPYASPNHHVIKSRYITSNDPRGYIPVYEYPLNGQWIMMDVDDGYILWTGIWKALGNSKADIVKMIESQPDLASQIRRVRGGYLKIQGTWMPYEVALRLSRRVAWPIRHDLVPLFGPTFPTTCLSPDQPGYGQVIANGGGRRRTRRSNHVQSSGILSAGSSGPQTGWTIISGPSYPHEISQASPQFSHQPTSPFTPSVWPAQQQQPQQQQQQQQQQQHQKIQSMPSPTDTLSIDGGVDRLSLIHERGHCPRYSPYPGPSAPNNPPFSSVSSPVVGTSRNSFSDPPGFTAAAAARRVPIQDERIKLPPLQSPTSTARASGQVPISLPPISSLAAPSSQPNDSRAVLKRLRASDAADALNPLPLW